MINKTNEAIDLSEDILWDIELNRISFEQIIYKTMRLCRLIDDFETMKWLTLELQWYGDTKIIDGVDKSEIFPIAIKHWRGVIDKQEGESIQKMRTSSVPELETWISSNIQKLQNLTLPTHYQPAISSMQTEWYYSNTPLKSEFVQEKYGDVVQKIRTEQNSIQVSITQNKDILSRIKNSLYSYVLWTCHKLKYSNITENIFQDRENVVLSKLSSNPKYNEIFSSIATNLTSQNPTDRENAVHNCRKLLQLFADDISPVDDSKNVKIVWEWKNEKTIRLWKEDYINRLVDYIENKTTSSTFQNIVGSHLDFIWYRIESIYKSTNKGTHSNVELTEAKRYTIYTYLLIADILEL